MNIQQIQENFFTLFQNTKNLNERLSKLETSEKNLKNTVDKLTKQISTLKTTIETGPAQAMGLLPDENEGFGESEGHGLVDGEVVIKDPTQGEKYLSPEELKEYRMRNAPQS